MRAQYLSSHHHDRLRPVVFVGLPFALAFVAAAFGLNLVWELVQCRLFFVHGSVPATLPAMFVATAGDVALSALIYGAVALCMRDPIWGLRGFSTRSLAVTLAFAVMVALLVEWRALSSGRWVYTGLMPLVPATQIGVIPILQLLLLVPLTVISARRWTERRASVAFQTRETPR